MAKMVGLSRKLKLPWLKYTVDLVADGIPESEIKDKLNEYLNAHRFFEKLERF